MSKKTIDSLHQTERHVLDLRRAYQRLLTEVEKRAKRENHSVNDLAKIFGIHGAHVQQVLNRMTVAVSGKLFNALLRYTEQGNLEPGIREPMNVLHSHAQVIGLITTSEESISAAFEINRVCERERGMLLRDEFAQLFPHADIVRGTLRYHTESVMKLTGETWDEIQTFILSDEENGMAQKVKRAQQQRAHEYETLTGEVQAIFDVFQSMGIKTRSQIAEHLGTTSTTISEFHSGRIRLFTLRQLAERARRWQSSALTENKGDTTQRSTPENPPNEAGTEEASGIVNRHDELVARIVERYGGKSAAARQLQISLNHLKPCVFRTMKADAKARILSELQVIVDSLDIVASGPEQHDQMHKESSASPTVTLDEFVPQQADIEMTRRLCRALISHLDLYSSIRNKGVRHAVRSTLEADLLDLLQALQRHAANEPGALAERFRIEERMRSEMQTTTTSSSRVRKGN